MLTGAPAGAPVARCRGAAGAGLVAAGSNFDFMNQFAIAAMGEDRPGIVAAVSTAILDVGGTIEDSSMTILGGHFAMLLVVEADVDAAAVQRALEPVAEELGLLLEVRTSSRHDFVDAERDDWVVAAYGPDRPGLVSALAHVLAGAGVNITDFGSRLGRAHTFAMWFNVSLPAATDPDLLGAALAVAGGDLGLDVRLSRAEAEEL